MLLPGRHANTGDYRYGFQGQELDNEIKGEGNSINYKYRMHDPRVGRFFAVDPLVIDYPYYSPYQFSGNTPMMSVEMEGLEPKVENGVLVGYSVMAGQGPTQIAKHLNDPRTQAKYGYTLIKPISWGKIVEYNFDTYKEKGNWVNPSGIFNKFYEAYSNLNINPGDVLKIGYKTEITSSSELTTADPWITQYKSEEMNLFIVGLEGSASLTGTGVSASMYGISEVPLNAPFWESGRGLNMESVNATLGTPGLEGSAQFGQLKIRSTKETSLTKILSGDNVSFSGGFISPFGMGIKVNYLDGDGYSIKSAGPTFGTPGPIGSGTSSGLSLYSKVGLKGAPMNRADSLRTAWRLSQYYPNSEFEHYYSQNQDSTLYTPPKPIKD